MSQKRIRESSGDALFNVTNIILLSLAAFLVLYPLWFVIIASISDPTLVNMGKVLLIPKGISFNAYKTILTDENILTGYRNTIYYAVVGTSLSVILTAMTAYAIAQKHLYGRKLITGALLLTMFFSGGIIPTFLIIDKVGLLDTPYTLLFVGVITTYNVIITRTYIQSSIPQAMLEAAMIDGCGDIGIFYTLVLPLSKPVLSVIALFYASAQWNGYFNALIYLNERNYMPLQIFLREILIQNSTSQIIDTEDAIEMAERANLARTLKYALIIVASLPMIIIYPFVQKYFVGGVMIGSVKG
ncbi:MAG: carbohydrate ABC transporter permease [Christensenellales bacterium]|jgi:putative aldouronate transport system permease protein